MSLQTWEQFQTTRANPKKQTELEPSTNNGIASVTPLQASAIRKAQSINHENYIMSIHTHSMLASKNLQSIYFIQLAWLQTI